VATPQRGASFIKYVVVAILGIALFYGAVAVTDPWALHIGGRSTLLLYWSGSGNLLTAQGTYPLYVFFYPATDHSQLPLDGLRPTAGVKGDGWICTAPGVTQHLNLTGTMYGGWSSTDGSLMSFHLNEPNAVDLGGAGPGYFDLYGHWQGPELVMNDRETQGSKLRSGLQIEHASIMLNWGSRSDFKERCAHLTGNESRP